MFVNFIFIILIESPIIKPIVRFVEILWTVYCSLDLFYFYNFLCLYKIHSVRQN